MISESQANFNGNLSDNSPSPTPNKHTSPLGKRNRECVKKENPQQEYTWLQLIKEPSVNQDTKLLAVNAIHDRMAYMTKVYSILCVYLDSRGIHYKKPREQTWKYYTDDFYKKMLARKRKAISNTDP